MYVSKSAQLRLDGLMTALVDRSLLPVSSRQGDPGNRGLTASGVARQAELIIRMSKIVGVRHPSSARTERA